MTTTATTPFSVDLHDAPRFIEDAAYVEQSLVGLPRRPMFRRPAGDRRLGGRLDMTI